jgi:hypothetical protein
MYEVLIDLKSVLMILYSDDIVLYGAPYHDDLKELEIALARISDY